MFLAIGLGSGLDAKRRRFIIRRQIDGPAKQELHLTRAQLCIRLDPIAHAGILGQIVTQFRLMQPLQLTQQGAPPEALLQPVIAQIIAFGNPHHDMAEANLLPRPGPSGARVALERLGQAYALRIFAAALPEEIGIEDIRDLAQGRAHHIVRCE